MFGKFCLTVGLLVSVGIGSLFADEPKHVENPLQLEGVADEPQEDLVQQGYKLLDARDDAKALALFKQAAEEENRYAYVWLGHCYRFGRGTATDYFEAARWYVKDTVVNENAKLSFRALGELYEYGGPNLPPDLDQSRAAYTKAAELGDEPAIAALKTLGQSKVKRGQQLQKETRYKEAFELFQEAVASGDKEAFYYLAVCFKFGQGTECDYAAAAQWYQKAIDASQSGTCSYALAEMYEYGDPNLKQDLDLAKSLYSQAVRWGHENAAAALKTLGQSKFKRAEALWNQEQYEQALPLYREAAEDEGDEDAKYAMSSLGFAYFYGKGVEKDYAEAVAWLTKAAAKDLSGAASLLGEAYEKGGWGIVQDFAAAKRWYERGAELGNELAAKRLENYELRVIGLQADQLWEDERYDEAVPLYSQAAIAGDSFSQYQVGNAFSTGRGVAQDLTESIRWYMMAAAQGDKTSAWQIAINYLKGGTGLDPDYVLAKQWFERAQELGQESAAGMLENYDRDVLWRRAVRLRDRGQSAAAVVLFKQGAEQGDMDAAFHAANLYLSGGRDLARDAEAAKVWFRKAKELEHPQGDLWLRLVDHPAHDDFRAGEELLTDSDEWEWRDPQQAFLAYHRAASQEHPRAQYRLAAMYDLGIGVWRDEILAFQWRLRAAEHGDWAATYRVARDFERGNGTAQDRDEAIRWYRTAMELKYPRAEEKLRELEALPAETADEIYDRALTYEFGIFAPPRPDLAQRDMRRAAEMDHQEACWWIGSDYANGPDKNYEEGMRWMHKSAELDSPVGCLILGTAYLEGLGQPRDLDEAERWYRRAGELGHRDAEKKLQEVLREKAYPGASEFGEAQHLLRTQKQPQEAFALFKKSAEAGNPAAERMLAVMYQAGLGTEVDLEAAERWYRLAAEHGDPEALEKQANNWLTLRPWLAEYQEAMRSMRDTDQPRDYAKSLAIFEKLANEHRSADAAFMLGTMYMKGQGVRADEEAALMWYGNAETWGSGQGALLEGLAFETAQGVDADIEQAGYYYSNALRLGATEAQKHIDRIEAEKKKPGGADYLLAEGLRTKNGLWREPQKAVDAYQRAAAAGHHTAADALGRLYLTSSLGAPDGIKAVEWLTKAATDGELANSAAMLGHIYERGEVLPRDLALAQQWFLKSKQLRGPVDEEWLKDFHRLAEVNLPGQDNVRNARTLFNFESPELDLEAVELLREPAAAGNHAAQFELGYCYLHGRGVSFDAATARDWLTRAADRGNASACRDLAAMNLWGLGGSTDVGVARRLFDRSLMLGNDGGKYLRNLAEYDLHPGAEAFGRGFRAYYGWLEPANFAKGLEQWEQAAATGHAYARYELAMHYRKRYERLKEEPDGTVAHRYLRQAARSHFAPARIEMGKARFAEDGVGAADHDMADYYFRQAIWAADPAACRYLTISTLMTRLRQSAGDDLVRTGTKLEEAGEQAQAEVAFLEAAELGNSRAMSKLGEAAWKRNDQSAALAWFEKAIQRGDPDSMVKLADRYRAGTGVDQDLRKAANYYRQAAYVGNAQAQQRLASMYGNGEGVKQDYFQKLFWLRAGAELNDANACQNLGASYARGIEVATDLYVAQYWTRRAIFLGNSGAQRNLSIIEQRLQQDDGFGYDLAQTHEWSQGADEQRREQGWQIIRAGAERGMPVAQRYLAAHYRSKSGPPAEKAKSQAEALVWYHKAAEQGDVESQWYLGMAYSFGPPEVEQEDLPRALPWLEKAAAQGHSEAKRRLEVVTSRMAREKKSANNPKTVPKGSTPAPSRLMIPTTPAKPKPDPLVEAAEKGSADAQFQLGLRYFQKQELGEAKKWWKKSAEQGNSLAKSFLEKLPP
jgi:TPR repeat protein